RQRVGQGPLAAWRWRRSSGAIGGKVPVVFLSARWRIRTAGIGHIVVARQRTAPQEEGSGSAYAGTMVENRREGTDGDFGDERGFGCLFPVGGIGTAVE